MGRPSLSGLIGREGGCFTRKQWIFVLDHQVFVLVPKLRLGNQPTRSSCFGNFKKTSGCAKTACAAYLNSAGKC